MRGSLGDREHSLRTATSWQLPGRLQRQADDTVTHIRPVASFSRARAIEVSVLSVQQTPGVCDISWFQPSGYVPFPPPGRKVRAVSTSITSFVSAPGSSWLPWLSRHVSVSLQVRVTIQCPRPFLKTLRPLRCAGTLRFRSSPGTAFVRSSRELCLHFSGSC